MTIPGMLNNGNRPGQKGGPMEVRRDKFVAEYIKTCNAKAAAIFAGYSPKNASRMGIKLLKEPGVIAAIDKVRKEIAEAGIYGLKKAMQETEEGMEFARATKNATALANILQLRAKLNDLIKDRTDIRMTGSLEFRFSGIDNSKAVEPLIEAELLSGKKDE